MILHPSERRSKNLLTCIIPFNISEIKKLPVEQKLKIIDELWESIDDSEINTLSQKEEINLLEERMELYEKGN